MPAAPATRSILMQNLLFLP